MLITAVQQSDLYVHIHSFFKIFFSIMVYNRIFLKRYMYFFFFTLFYLFIWLHWVFVAACGLSLVAASGGYSLLQCAGFL